MKRIAGLGIFLAVVVLLAQCRAPWHMFENPVDPESPTYIGTPSVDNNGNGIPQYIDVEEIELIAPADDAVSATVTPVLTAYLFDPSLVKRYWIQIATDIGFASGVLYDEDPLPGNAVTVPEGRLNNNTTYFWRAKAYDGTKWSTGWSETRVFSIHLALGVPGNPAPVDGSPSETRRPTSTGPMLSGPMDTRSRSTIRRPWKLRSLSTMVRSSTLVIRSFHNY